MSNPKSILIIDDEPSIICLLDILLKNEGYRVFTAENGKEGIELASKHKPDIIITDIKMPIMSGYMMVYLLKQIDILKDIPIILLTSAAQMAGSISLDIPVEKKIKKPIKPIELLKALKAFS